MEINNKTCMENRCPAGKAELLNNFSKKEIKELRDKNSGAIGKLKKSLTVTISRK